MNKNLSDRLIKSVRAIRKVPKEQIKNPFEIQLIVVNFNDNRNEIS